MPVATMRAKDLVDLLAYRHAGDVFVPECKTGSSQFDSSCPRLDAWAMKKSWLHPCAIGYEIKVSRNDFLKDEKWVQYLEFCNQFYFVCPTGLIAVEEVPEQAGLLWVAKTGTRLYTKRKAPHREVEVPASLYEYLLMARTVVTREDVYEQADFWRHWLAERDEHKDLGHAVSKKIRELIEKQIDDVSSENRRMLKLMESYADVRKTLAAMEIDTDEVWGMQRAVDRRIELLRGKVGEELNKALGALNDVLYKLRR